MKITSYKGIPVFFGQNKADFVKNTVHTNLYNWNSPRSINGGGVGNRHARKHGIKMYTFEGKVLSRGHKPIKMNEFNPDF